MGGGLRGLLRCEQRRIGCCRGRILCPVGCWWVVRGLKRVSGGGGLGGEGECLRLRGRYETVQSDELLGSVNEILTPRLAFLARV